MMDRYFTPKETGFTALWFHVIPLDENNTRVINHAVFTAPLPGVLQWLAGEALRFSDVDSMLVFVVCMSAVGAVSQENLCRHLRCRLSKRM